MPETRSERIVFGIGILAIAALVALIVLETTTDRFKRHPTPAALPPMMTATTTSEAAPPPPRPTTEETTTKETTTPPEQARPPATGVRLTLRAIADTWVDVRAGSLDGDGLYAGILPEGTVKRFRGTRIWVRFGAASNLTARLNGMPLRLPPGTYSALVGARGLQQLAGG
jgi:Domain of unknown function (DUF4115)